MLDWTSWQIQSYFNLFNLPYDCFFSGIRDSPILKSNTELENRSVAAERRVGHMALLLSESEAENARLNELANVLKEEIRSNQRSEERMKHIENLEYVKNIIFKVKSLLRNIYNFLTHSNDLVLKVR